MIHLSLYLLIDTSGSMEGNKIGAVNDAICNVIPTLNDISDANPDVEIKIAALSFSSGVEWLYNEPKLSKEFVWKDVVAGGLTSLGYACHELASKLSYDEYQKSAESFAPAIILLSDGSPSDDFNSGLKKLQDNHWFKAAIKIAIAIGEDADKDVLTKFTGSSDSVITVHNVEALKQIIHVVTVTSAQIGSKSNCTENANKQDVIKEIKNATYNIEGVVFSDCSLHSKVDCSFSDNFSGIEKFNDWGLEFNNQELEPNDKVTLTNGVQATVIKELGRGGQGIVYLVDFAGRQMALKWYHNPPSDAFYKNLEKNVNAGAPSDAFIWPEYLTVKEKGSYGYIMRLRPNDYFEFGNYLLGRKHFKSFEAMLAAAMKICDGLKMLHRYGYSYQDLNDGNFLIRPEDGDVLFCDNDNVMPHGELSGIMGKARYMAPEIVAGGKPDKYSERFSLSVILFMLFFANHPFEGAKVVACPCMTETFEKKFYGSEALFIYDNDDKSNLPVPGVHQNVIRRWPLFPSILKQTFIEQFDRKKLQNPTTRMTEMEWLKILKRVRDELVVCPKCHKDTFVDMQNGNNRCLNCGYDIDISESLLRNSRIEDLKKETEQNTDI